MRSTKAAISVGDGTVGALSAQCGLNVALRGNVGALIIITLGILVMKILAIVGLDT